MIVKGLFELVYSLLNIVLTPFQVFPDLPNGFYVTIDRFISFITSPVGLFAFFIDVGFVRAILPLVIIIANMEHIWDGILWILKKLPFVGIE